MKEMVEFRIDEQYAPMLFEEKEGKRLGKSVRKIEIETDDPRFQQIGRLQRELRDKKGEPFFYGWNLRLTASHEENQHASLFLFKITAVFEPAGEERGTVYDESSACPRCGAGAEQVGPLILDLKRIPKSKDIAKTIAGEIVVSRRVVKIFERYRISGVKIKPVRLNTRSSAESKDWFQLTVQSTDAEIVPPTRIGIDPFNDDRCGESRCTRGDLLGLNLLSQVTIQSATRRNDDFIASRHFIGARRGLLRPERLIFASPNVRNLVASEKVRGCELEVARLAQK